MLIEIIFLILALIILVGALKMLNATEPVHAAIYLGLVLLGVAGVYLTLGAEFLAAIQVLIYVGAVVTLILFAVMLTSPSEESELFDVDKTPLSVFGFKTPAGVDVERVDEVPPEAESIDQAERELKELSERAEEVDRDEEASEAESAREEEPAGDEVSDEAEEPATDDEPPEEDR